MNLFERGTPALVLAFLSLAGQTIYAQCAGCTSGGGGGGGGSTIPSTTHVICGNGAGNGALCSPDLAPAGVAPLASPTFTGTVGGITAAMVGALVPANNLSDLSSVPTALTNLGIIPGSGCAVAASGSSLTVTNGSTCTSSTQNQGYSPTVTCWSGAIVVTGGINQVSGNQTVCVPHNDGAGNFSSITYTSSTVGSVLFGGVGPQGPTGTTGTGCSTLGGALSGTCGAAVVTGFSASSNTLTGPGSSGTAATLAGTESLSNKTVDGVTSSVMAFLDATSSIQTQLNLKGQTTAVSTLPSAAAAVLHANYIWSGATSANLCPASGAGGSGGSVTVTCRTDDNSAWHAVLTTDAAGNVTVGNTVLNPTTGTTTPAANINGGNGIYILPFSDSAGYPGLNWGVTTDGNTFGIAGGLSINASTFSDGIDANFSPVKYNGKWYMAMTAGASEFSTGAQFRIAISVDNSFNTWQNVLLYATGLGTTVTWAPEMFVDPVSGTLYIYFAAGNGTTTNNLYVTKLNNPAAIGTQGSWSTPTLLASGSLIDPFMFYFGGTYQLWFANQSNNYLEMSTSTTPDGTFTASHTGNWTGIGTGEGPSVIQWSDGTYRIYQCLLSGSYKYVTTSNFSTFSSVTNVIEPPGLAGAQSLTHGTIVHLTDEDDVRNALAAYDSQSTSSSFRSFLGGTVLTPNPNNTRPCHSFADASGNLHGALCMYTSTGEMFMSSTTGNAINFYPGGGSNVLSLTSGALTVNVPPKFAGTNTTGSTPFVPAGSNCPATTCTTPYTWVQATSSDGSTVYIPVFK